MLKSASTAISLRKSVKPRSYIELSPRTLSFRKIESSQVIKLQECDDGKEIKPNMELRKSLIRVDKINDSKQDVYHRNKLWQEKTLEKLNGKRWDLKVSEMSSCTFAPSLTRMASQKKLRSKKALIRTVND